MTDEKVKYANAQSKRKKHVDAILNSTSNKNIVVAGPGTGKTYLFKMILEGKKDTLTLSFVNALVEDLSLDLCGISDVKTLHGFALSTLKTATKNSIKIFPKLTIVIKEDAKLLLDKEVDFDDLFHNRDDDNEHIEFYKNRKNYYDHYGFSDIVFAAVKYFELNKHKIPDFTQVVVDEFQDFNKLEVSLIDLLAKKSPILLAGDDDQALYESLKSASAKHIRQRHGGNNSDYTPFSLPFCSRCTQVIVEAINDIITNATKDGYLNNRIPKPFLYFDGDETKNKESEKYSQIVYKSLHAKQIPWFIQQQIEEIAKEVKGQIFSSYHFTNKSEISKHSNRFERQRFQEYSFRREK